LLEELKNEMKNEDKWWTESSFFSLKRTKFNWNIIYILNSLKIKNLLTKKYRCSNI
jgi:hypothetical protein